MSKSSGLRPGTGLEPATPLWQRVPTRDENGLRLSDFMMLIPGLNKAGSQHIEGVIVELECALGHYTDIVCFADLNLKLNLLWVSVRPVPGICLELPTAIQLRIPEALLIAQRLPDTENSDQTGLWRHLSEFWRG